VRRAGQRRGAGGSIAMRQRSLIASAAIFSMATTTPS
jgi:hypothetical protein